MFSQRGLFHLAHTVHDMQEITRRGYSNHLNGIDAEILDKEQVLKKIPYINGDGRYPIMGAPIIGYLPSPLMYGIFFRTCSLSKISASIPFK